MVLVEKDFKDRIVGAQERIKPFAHKTPVLSSQTLNQISSTELYFKCENFQKVVHLSFAVPVML